MLQSRMRKYSFILMVFFVSLACRQSVQPLAVPTIIYKPAGTIASPTSLPPVVREFDPPGIRRADDASIASPTPDEPRELPEIRMEEQHYTVQVGDSLGTIATRYRVTVPMLLRANLIFNPDYLEVGQELVIPAPTPGEQGEPFKIIPDSELVYGPNAAGFDVTAFVSRYDSFLGRYYEQVESEMLSGPEIVQFVARDYSVNPRLLLAVLEYQSGWVTQANPAEETRVYPIGEVDSWRTGLYAQLAWTANSLNRGYYEWKTSQAPGWLLNDGTIVPADPTINAGTAAVLQLFAYLKDRPAWDEAVSPEGVYQTYGKFFGHPFDYTFDPLIPEGLAQPEMQLPFEPDVLWAYTGGPHGGWGDGSPWAALDFAPGNDGRGCIQSDLWVVASADGTIIRSDQGRVIQDLDNDGNEGTGWVILYMHIEGRDRVSEGTYLQAGERIGHPSCEGGYSTGTHVHLARRYNGEWISAERTNLYGGLPFNLDGWVSSGNGIEYDGHLERDGEFVEAWEGVYPGNTVSR